MATDPASSNADAFFARCGLPPGTRERCWAMARGLFPGRTIEEVKPQGYCSHTLLVGQDTIVQFRPPAHRLDIRLAMAAREIYGSLAPRTELLGWLEAPSQPSPKDAGDEMADSQALVDEAIAIDDDDHQPGSSLHVYCMTRIPGVSLAEVLVSSRKPPLQAPRQLRQQRETIVENFADFTAAGWASARPAPDPTAPGLRGRVGRSLRWRLEAMISHLPPRFRPAAGGVLDRLGEIESLPWALTHGDVRPANVMVRSRAGGPVVSGFLDWAEAEYLPLGVGLYGLEELLGEGGVDGRFSYYVEADGLRQIFWSRLAAGLPDMDVRAGTSYRGVVEAAHVLGVLLWHGIAFDDGRLDRVVEEGRDDDEIWRLDIFFRQRHKEESRVHFSQNSNDGG